MKTNFDCPLKDDLNYFSRKIARVIIKRHKNVIFSSHDVNNFHERSR